MKIILTIIIFLTTINLTHAQEMIYGNYRGNFGCEIELKKDSTFKFTWRFDLYASWSIGDWTIQNDTIYFEIIPVFDTLRYFDESRKVQIDSLVFSIDEKTNVITKEEYEINQTFSSGQSIYEMPSKLFFKNQRLYHIDEKGKLIKKKVKGFWSNKKYNPWYIRK